MKKLSLKGPESSINLKTPPSNTNKDYDFLITLTDNIKDKNYIIAQRKIGNYIHDLYQRVHTGGDDCPGSIEQKMMMTGAETLFVQLRGIVGNTNFAHLFGLKTITKLGCKPSQNRNFGKTASEQFLKFFQ